MNEAQKKKLLACYREDKLFRQWSATLNRLARHGLPSAVEVWTDTLKMVGRLQSLHPDDRDLEIDYIYTDLCEWHPDSRSLPITIMTVLYTMLADAAPDKDHAEENPHDASCCAIVRMLGKNHLFHCLLSSFFLHQTDNRGRPVVLPVTDYVACAVASDEADEASAPPIAADDGMDDYRYAISLPTFADAHPFVTKLHRDGHHELGDRVVEHFRKMEESRQSHPTIVEKFYGTVNGDSHNSIGLPPTDVHRLLSNQSNHPIKQ